MAQHSSATTREETPHVLETSRTNTIINALKRRVEAVLNDESLDPQSRAVIRSNLELTDPWLMKLVRHTNGSERTDDTSDLSPTPYSQQTSAPDPRAGKIELLAEIICRGGDDTPAALLVLMGTIQNSTDPKALANTVKHFAFTRCGELNVFGMIDAQIALLEGELLTGSSLAF